MKPNMLDDQFPRDSSEYFSDSPLQPTSSQIRSQKAQSRGKSSLHRKWTSTLGWIFISISQMYLIYLLLSERLAQSQPYFAADPYHIAPKFSQTIIKFKPEMDHYVVSNRSSFQERLEVRQRWADLVPRGNGGIRVPHSDKYTQLASPLIHYETGEEYYLTSLVHQLHCLYVIMDSYDTLMQKGESVEKVHRLQHPIDHVGSHIDHCFDYLRQALMCHGDTALEGLVPGVSTNQTDGWGHPHVCKNYGEISDWIDAKRISDNHFI